MSNLVENSVAEKIDTYFKATPSDTGTYWSLKVPWNKTYRWVKASQYFKFRYDIAELLVPPEPKKEDTDE